MIRTRPLRPRFDDHRTHLAALRAAALAAVDPAAAVRRWLSAADLDGADKVYLVGAGKAGAAMATAAAEIAGDKLAAGVMAVPHLPASAPDRVTFVEGGHPSPTTGQPDGRPGGGGAADAWPPSATWCWR